MGERRTGIRIENLDLLRFIAAFAVFSHHLFYAGPVEHFLPDPGPALFYIGQYGQYGVDVFFVISGFVIAFCSEGSTATRFLRARCLRIAPAYLLCCLWLACWALPAGTPFADRIKLVAANLTFVPQAFHLDYLSRVFWTLTVEVQFYGMVFVLMLLRLWPRFQVSLLLGWLGIAVVQALTLDNHALARVFLLEYAGHFAAGGLLYHVILRGADRRLLLGLIPALLLMQKFEIRRADWWLDHGGPTIPHPVAWAVAATAVALVAVSVELPRLSLPKGWPAVLGKTSYTLYLINASLGPPLIVWLLRKGVPTWPAEVAGALVTCGAAAIAALYLEEPLRAAFRKALPGGAWRDRRAAMAAP